MNEGNEKLKLSKETLVSTYTEYVRQARAEHAAQGRDYSYAAVAMVRYERDHGVKAEAEAYGAWCDAGRPGA